MALEHAASDVSINRFHCAEPFVCPSPGSIVLIKDFPLIVPFSFLLLLLLPLLLLSFLLSFISFGKKPQHVSVIRKLENCFAKWLLNCFCLFTRRMAIIRLASLNVRPGLLPTVVELIYPPSFPLFLCHSYSTWPAVCTERLAISGRTIQQLLLPIVIN